MDEKKILIIDNEQRMADSLASLLVETGYQARTAYGGVEAIELLGNESFHVVVTDLRMQDIDGLDVIRFVHDNHPRTLLIVITGHATTESAIEAVHYQVFDYLRKPFDFDLFRMAIEKAFQKIETDQLREDTAAMITHDIKIPLTSIIGFASLMYDREEQQIHPQAGDFAETIYANGQKILELIENYLTTCKIEAGTFKVQWTRVNLHRMFDDVIETQQVEALRRGRELAVKIIDIPEAIYLDEVMTYRALSNLINNGIKYSSGAGQIEIKAQMIMGQDSPLGIDSVHIEVINDTNVVLPEESDEIFDRFERGAGTFSSIEGSGIGLYVVKAVAQAHQGRTGAGMLADGRVCFSIILPLYLQHPHATAPGPED